MSLKELQAWGSAEGELTLLPQNHPLCKLFLQWSPFLSFFFFIGEEGRFWDVFKYQLPSPQHSAVQHFCKDKFR